MRTEWFETTFNTVYDNVTGISDDKVQDGYGEGVTEGVLRLPDCYSEDGDPVPLILCAHGSGGRVSREENKAGGIGYAAAAISAGYAAFDIHGTRPDGRSYGNRRYTEAVWRAYRYILKNYNVEPGLFVCGASMGGLSAMNYLNIYPGTVRAVGLFYPRLNLKEVTVNGVRYRGSWDVPKKKEGFLLKDIISEEYGFTETGVWEPEKTVGLDPWYNRTVVIDGKRHTFLPCPIKIWHGAHDVTVDYALSTEYIAGVRRAGGYAELRTLECRKHAHGDVMHEELRLWFDRFR